MSSKIFKDFQKRRASPSGDLIQIQQNYVLSVWNDIEHCIKNRLPMYGLAGTQSGKTFLKFWVAYYAIKKKVVDNVIISTTNLTGAKKQIFYRAKEWALQYDLQIKSTDDKDASMIKGDIFISMTNANRTNFVDKIVNDAECTAKKFNKPAPRILVIVDEGEEFHQSTETSTCDTALGNLLIHKNHNINVLKISATLLSHMLIHGQFSDLGMLTKEQVFRIPTHPDYKGLSSSTIQNPFILPALTAESNWNGAGYTSSATTRNTKNPKIIVDEVEKLINEQKNIGDDAQTKKLVQIGNVVAGDSTAGHLRMAGLIASYFQRTKQRTVEIWDNKESSQLKKTSEIVIIIHNGSAKDLSVAEKLSQIAHHWDRSKLKAILIVSKKMTSKSISVECNNWYDPASPEFGFYCNFTAYYGPGSENITVAIQAMRCTGIRPLLKKHVMWTTDETKQDIENYYDQIENFISHLNLKGKFDNTQLIPWVPGYSRALSKKKVQTQYIGNSGVRSHGNNIANSDRHNYVEADALIKSTAKDYARIGTNVALAIEYVLEHGFTPISIDPKECETFRNDTFYNSYDDARNAFRNHTKGKNVKFHWVKIKNRYYLYVKNKMNGETRVEYNVNNLVDGRPAFDSSRLYKSASDYLYEVK